MVLKAGATFHSFQKSRKLARIKRFYSFIEFFLNSKFWFTERITAFILKIGEVSTKYLSYKSILYFGRRKFFYSSWSEAINYTLNPLSFSREDNSSHLKSLQTCSTPFSSIRHTLLAT